jgi:undecaprenyl-diphosphatase
VPFSLLQIIILGLIQGATELLPVSSSAHVIIAEKLMGIDPVTPEATFLLIMLHAGTMLAVLVYFWRSWVRHYFSDHARLQVVARQLIVATAITGVIGLGLKYLIEKICLAGAGSAEVESLFGNLPLMATSLAVVGILILIAGSRKNAPAADAEITTRTANWMGVMQGLSLPFRGFSRSGSTISAALVQGAGRQPAEEFSFALGLILTPPLIALLFQRLEKLHAAETAPHHLIHLLAPGLIGMVCSFVAGLLGLRLLSRWLAAGHWKYFGFYCIAAAIVVFGLHVVGF